MKKTLLVMLVIIFVATGYTAESWAMGKFKKRRGDVKHVKQTSHSNHKNSGNTDSSESFAGPQTQTTDENQNNTDAPDDDPNNTKNNSSNPNEETNEEETTQFVSNPHDQTENYNHRDETEASDQLEEQKPYVVPEPMTLTLMGMGLAGLLLKRRKG